MWYLEVYELVQKEFQEGRQAKFEDSLLSFQRELSQGIPLNVAVDEESGLFHSIVEHVQDQKYLGTQSVEWQKACQAHWRAESAHWKAAQAHWDAEKVRVDAETETRAENERLTRQGLGQVVKELQKLRLFGIRPRKKKGFSKRKRY